jgi:hypothetical protein
MHLTKERDSSLFAPVSPASAGEAGAPGTISSLDVNALRGFERGGPPFGRVLPLSPRPLPSVRLWVSDEPLDVPEPLLSASLSHLALTTEGYVSLDHYAEAVGELLTALANSGFVSVQNEMRVRDSDIQAIPA